MSQAIRILVIGGLSSERKALVTDIAQQYADLGLNVFTHEDINPKYDPAIKIKKMAENKSTVVVKQDSDFDKLARELRGLKVKYNALRQAYSELLNMRGQ